MNLVVILLQVAVAEQLLAAQLHIGLACRHIWAAHAVQVTYMHMQQVSILSQRHANNDSLDPVLPLLNDDCDTVSSLLTLLACTHVTVEAAHTAAIENPITLRFAPAEKLPCGHKGCSFLAVECHASRSVCLRIQDACCLVFT
jgi:hypothetical protein